MTRSVALLLLLTAGAARAATFTVDTTSDVNLAACTPAPADCSLRGAIAASNGVPGAHRIEFALPSADAGFQAATQHWRFDVVATLPAVSGNVVIDGFTQAGAVPNTNPVGFPIGHVIKLEIRGPNLATDGLMALPGSRLTLRGVALTNFNRAVFLFEPGPHVVAGNHFGVDVGGQVAAPNRYGLSPAGDTTIGGTTGADANVFAANNFGAITLQRQVTRLRVQGNFIGVAADGVTVPGRQDYGVQLIGAFNDVLIGGDPQTARNVISGNAFNAVYASGQGVVLPGAPQLRVQGNYFGLSAVGEVPVGNGLNPGSPSQPMATLYAFRLDGCGVQFGGTAPGEGNVIAHGGAAGVQIASCRDAPVLGNLFRGNRGVPIDTSVSSNADGSTPPDAGDADDGGNRLQNGVRVESMAIDASADTLQLALRVDTASANAAYPLRIDFYREDATGTFPVASDVYSLADAQQPRTYTLPLALVGTRLHIGVTDANGNSGELVGVGDLFADGFESP